MGANLTGIDGITNGDNDVLIVVYRYPVQQYQSLKALVFDFRSTKVKAISQINGSWRDRMISLINISDAPKKGSRDKIPNADLY